MQCLRRPFVASFGIWDEIHRKLHRNRASILAARTHKLLHIRSDGEPHKRAAFVSERPHREDRNPTGIELPGVPAWRNVNIDADCAGFGDFGRSVSCRSCLCERSSHSVDGSRSALVMSMTAGTAYVQTNVGVVDRVSMASKSAQIK